MSSSFKGVFLDLAATLTTGGERGLVDSREPHCGLIIKSQLFVPWSSPTFAPDFTLLLLAGVN